MVCVVCVCVFVRVVCCVAYPYLRGCGGNTMIRVGV